MFVTHSQDMQSYGPATFFRNNGSNFTKVSIPTANIWIPKQKLPISGVYAVECKLEDVEQLTM